jgi:hypothetical protein
MARTGDTQGVAKHWQPLDQLSVSAETHNPDVIQAVATVRDVIRSRSLPNLDPHSVLADASPKLRAVYFRFEHRLEPDTVVEIRQGDGYTSLRSPGQKYDGYIPDEEFRAFVDTKLAESFGSEAASRKEP